MEPPSQQDSKCTSHRQHPAAAGKRGLFASPDELKQLVSAVSIPPMLNEVYASEVLAVPVDLMALDEMIRSVGTRRQVS
jgi:hypothetical protein